MELKYELPRFGADGKFGPETLEAIKKFQTDNGITANGKATKQFIDTLTKKLSPDSTYLQPLKSLLASSSEVANLEKSSGTPQPNTQEG
jgi:peptidoglycan hydrolase-like protein with peptidoglycan-binding domain